MKYSCGESRHKPSCLFNIWASADRESKDGDRYIRGGTTSEGRWPNGLVALYYANGFCIDRKLKKEWPDET